MTDSPMIDPILGALCRPGCGLEVVRKRMISEGVTESEWDVMVSEAKGLLNRGASVDIVRKFREAEERFNLLYDQALHQHELSVALSAEREIVRLYELDKVSTSSSVNESAESATVSSIRASLEPMFIPYGVPAGLPILELVRRIILVCIDQFGLPKERKKRGSRAK